jgi:hypothetical protein
MQAKKQWSEQLKIRLTSFIRQTRKPFYRPKKEKVKAPNKKKEELEVEKPEPDDDGASISSSAPSNVVKEEKKKEDSNLNIIGNGLHHGQ